MRLWIMILVRLERRLADRYSSSSSSRSVIKERYMFTLPRADSSDSSGACVVTRGKPSW